MVIGCRGSLDLFRIVLFKKRTILIGKISDIKLGEMTSIL